MRRVLFSGSWTWRGLVLARLCRAIAALGAACMILAAVSGCGDESSGPATGSAGSVEVTVVTVTPQDIPVAFEHIAQTRSSHEVNIHARVSGFLDKHLYTEGSLVKEGQVLFLMDTKPSKAQLDREAAALAKQQAGLEVARADLERTKPLVAQKALSQKDLDDATGQFHASEAAVEECRARLETAELNLSYCTIVSPVTGISGAVLQHDGTYINPMNSLLTTVAVLDPIWVNFSISENEMQSYRDQLAKGLLRVPSDSGFVVEVSLADGSPFSRTGRITFAAPSYNAQTGTFLLRASVENPEGILRPNQYVRARLKGAIRPAGILIPQRALQQGSGGHFVWVVDKEGKAERRPVVVGKWHGDDWFISEGLHGGDQVIVDGSLALRDGAPVSVKPEAVAPAPVGDSISVEGETGS